MTNLNIMCEDTYEYLLKHDQNRLFNLVENGHLDTAEMTFALEILGRSLDSNRVVTTLSASLKSKSALIREGAMLGFVAHMYAIGEMPLEALAALETSSKYDPLQILRKTASEIIDEAVEYLK